MPIETLAQTPGGGLGAEQTVWTGRPSQWLNLGAWVKIVVGGGVAIAALLWIRPRLQAPTLHTANSLALVLVIGWALVTVWTAYQRIAGTGYELTNQRLLITTGVLNKHRRDIELRRVQDFAVREPFWLRLIGRGDVLIYTADRATGDIVLHAIADPKGMDNQIRQLVRASQSTAGSREINVL